MKRPGGSLEQSQSLLRRQLLRASAPRLCSEVRPNDSIVAVDGKRSGLVDAISAAEDVLKLTLQRVCEAQGLCEGNWTWEL